MARSESVSTSDAKSEEKLEQFAEDLGRLLGTVQAKAEGWVGQRNAIARQLTNIRDAAGQLLRQLGSSGAEAASRGRPRAAAPSRSAEPAARKSAPAKRSSRKKRVFSPETREKMRQAQLKRWAAHRAG